MLIFKCNLSQSEQEALKNLPPDDFCIVKIRGEENYYGVMKDELHSRFMDILSGESLEQLEYLDESELKTILKGGGEKEIGGSRLLLKKFE